MGDPIGRSGENAGDQSTGSPSSSAKIGLPKSSLEKLMRGLFSAEENGWKIDIKVEDGLPKPLVLVVHKLLKAFRDTMEKKDQQITSLCHANVRVLFLNEALGLINEITDDSYINNTITDQYEKVLDDVMHATSASMAAMMFIDTNANVSEFYAQGMEGEAKKLNDKYIKMLGFIASQFIENKNKTIIVNEQNDFIKALNVPQGHAEITSLIVLPLILKDKQQLRGVLYLANKRDQLEFDDNDQTVCELIVTEISNVYEKLSLTRQLRKEKDEQARLLTEIQHAQDQLLQSEKMASIGQLAAGVAHEINNPVGYINSNINSMQNYINQIFDLIKEYQSVEEFLPEEQKTKIVALREEADLEFLQEDVVDLVDESIEGVTRVKQIVNDLKNFSRVDEAEWAYANLESGIESTLNIAHNEIKYKAEIKKNYQSIPDVWCIASQINQVIMNMLVNAAHAIEERGVITISTGMHDDDTVFMKFKDDGCGIAEDKIGKIFDPFYTSKAVGDGTGLGLSLSFGIVEKHDGKIEVESVVGQGTEFTVLLPVNKQN